MAEMYFGMNHPRLGKVTVFGEPDAVKWAGVVLFRAGDAEARGEKPISKAECEMFMASVQISQMENEYGKKDRP